jgi:PRTRC genetic system protein C
VARIVNYSVNLQRKKELRMTIRKMTRHFRYAGLLLPDPAPDLDVESVRCLYAASYPEITTAALTGPEAVDGALVYTFTKAIEIRGASAFFGGVPFQGSCV